ncbi:hypothetical protein JCM19314_2445 [Nonlabens ulvanivorans]|uniref:Uncharacterized protein n=1 Tax=Nonlabens ulvanivorans TaxID=906888 RepID=A0A090Q5P0_NONUL|nr:hypothetical protein JCM19314_2445 [Nonlabens ulvanivorans]
MKSAGEVLSVFPDSKEYDFIIEELADEIFKSSESASSLSIASYLFNELKDNDHFTVSTSAIQLKEAFEKKIKSQNADLKFKKSLEACEDEKSKVELVRHWVSAFAKATQNNLY